MGKLSLIFNDLDVKKLVEDKNEWES
jgi:hypothetical protein